MKIQVGRIKIWDISVPVGPGLPVWPGDPQIVLERYVAISRGDLANVSRLACSVHSGTHVDAPVHFVQGGSAVDGMPLDVLIGPAAVVELLDVEVITPARLEHLNLLPPPTRLLFKTSNSQLWANPHHEFSFNYVALTSEAAEWVVRKGIRLVGVDYLSVQRFTDREPLTHRVLLEGGVVIVEGLDLREVPPGHYQLVCLPMKLVGSDGAPARAVLIG